jgi:hypothetical protein
LAGDTQAHAGNGFSAGFRNRFVAFFAVAQAFTTWNLIAGATNRVFDSRVDLILYCSFPFQTLL